MNNKPNKTFNKYQKLLGTWDLSGSHRLMPGVKLTGTCTISWLQEGGLLSIKTLMDQKEIPEMIGIIGHDDKNAPEKDTLLYFDIRGVSRIFEVELTNETFKYWRNAPHFSQRFTGTFENNGNTIIGLTELCEDDVNWMDDLKLTYTKK